MKYNPALDGLRAIAVLLVVLFHSFPTKLPGGWVGVEIFFVLSGFLITTILSNEISATGRISYLRFYAHRALRLMPEACALFAFQFARAIFSSHRAEVVGATIVSMLYFMNWNRAFDLWPQDVLGHLWSLSTEEQFYFVWPTALGLIFAQQRRLSWLVATIAAIVLWRSFLALEGASVERTYNGFDTHGDGLLIGCLLSFLPQSERLRLGRFGWIALGAFLVALPIVPYDVAGMQSFGLTIVSCCAAVLVSSALAPTILSRMLSLRPLVFTGKISYGWYLWHYPILILGFRHGFSGPVPKLSLIALSYGVATISYFVLARPASLLKDRHFKSSYAHQSTQAPVLSGNHE